MVEENSIIVECMCGTHMLKVQYYADDTGSVKQQDFYLSMFSFGSRSSGFIERLKYAWRHIISGRVHDDQLILDKAVARSLADFINKKLSDSERHDEQ